MIKFFDQPLLLYGSCKFLRGLSEVFASKTSIGTISLAPGRDGPLRTPLPVLHLPFSRENLSFNECAN